MHSSWFYHRRLALLQWTIMGVTYRISEKEKESEKYTLSRTDLQDNTITLGKLGTLGEAIDLAEVDAKDLV